MKISVSAVPYKPVKSLVFAGSLERLAAIQKHKDAEAELRQQQAAIQKQAGMLQQQAVKLQEQADLKRDQLALMTTVVLENKPLALTMMGQEFLALLDTAYSKHVDRSQNYWDHLEPAFKEVFERDMVDAQIQRFETLGLLTREQRENYYIRRIPSRSERPRTFRGPYFALSKAGRELLNIYHPQAAETARPNTEAAGVVQMAKVADPTRDKQVAMLLKENASGMTGFDLLCTMAELGQKNWFRKTTVTESSVIAATGRGVPDVPCVLRDMKNAGYLTETWVFAGKHNSQWRLTPAALAVLKHQSLQAMIQDGALIQQDLRQFVQAEMGILTAEQQKQQGVVKGLKLQLQEAQERFVEMPQNRVRAETLEELQTQVELAERVYQQNEVTLNSAIQLLKEKQVRMQLNQNNELLLQMLEESRDLVKQVQQQLHGVSEGIDLQYQTNRAALNPEAHLVTLKVTDRIQQRISDAKAQPLADGEAVQAAASIQASTHVPAVARTHEAQA